MNMFVVWVIALCAGLIMVIKAETIANLFKGIYFSSTSTQLEKKYRLGKNEGFWKIVGIILAVVSMFLISGGDELLISKSTDAILESTLKEDDVLR